MRNECAKTRKLDEPYEIWAIPGTQWEWRVLKKWQTDDDKPFARWFCAVKSEMTYGFSCPSKMYPNINRLMMMLITCRDMEQVVMACTKKNRIWKIKGLQTTCLSKYRDIKLNKGLLERIGREKLPNGMYKTRWKTDWHPRSFKDCIKDFISEDKLCTRTSNAESESLPSTET